MNEGGGRGSDPENRETPRDEGLLEAIRDGDVDALQLLMDREWQGLLDYAARMLGAPDDAEDIAQEVFVRVWEHRARWRAGGSARGYLYRIARNLILLEQRHGEVRERTSPEVRSMEPRVSTPHEDALHQELRVAFEGALCKLPERRREAFILVRLQGLSTREAAEVMTVTARTVTNQVYRATRELEVALRHFLSET